MPRRHLDARQKAGLAANLAIIVGCAAAAVATSRDADWRPIKLALVLAGFAVATELLAFVAAREPTPSGDPRRWVVSPAAPYVLAATLMGPAPAAAVGALAIGAISVRDRNPLIDVAANIGNNAAFAVTGGLLARWASTSFDLTPDRPAFALLVLGIYVYVNAFSLMGAAAYDQLLYGAWSGGPIEPVLKAALITEVPAALLTAATALAYGSAGLVALALLVLLPLVFQYIVRALALSELRADQLERRAKRIAALSASRGRLVGQVLHAEERERRRLAEALHDEALQNLLAARQDLAPASNEDGRARARDAIDRTIAHLREEIFELHPVALSHSGLAAALDAVARDRARYGGFEVRVEVAPGASGVCDALLFSLAREQLTNAAKHAAATEVTVAIARLDGTIVMDIEDDGCGMDDACRAAAVHDGHVGLASSVERVEALGGSLEIASAPGAGTRLRTRIPIDGSGST